MEAVADDDFDYTVRRGAATLRAFYTKENSFSW